MERTAATPTRWISIAACIALVAGVLAFAPAADAWVCDNNVTGPVVVTSYYYTINDNVTVYTSLDLAQPHLAAGDDITVHFTLGGCEPGKLSFVSYNALADQSDLDNQTVYDHDNGTFGPGAHTMTITVPPCFYQIDFVYGDVIWKFDEKNNVTYHGQQRFIDGTTGGAECTTVTTSPPPSTQIPFFPSTSALVLASVGALGAAMIVLRRRQR